MRKGIRYTDEFKMVLDLTDNVVFDRGLRAIQADTHPNIRGFEGSLSDQNGFYG